MPALPTLPSMPMGIAAKDASTPPSVLPSLPMPPAPSAPPMDSAMPPVAAGAPPAGVQSQGAPSAPAAPSVPYQVRRQSDGSIVAYIPSPDGDPSKDVAIGVAPAFKVPKAFQAPLAPQPQAPMM